MLARVFWGFLACAVAWGVTSPLVALSVACKASALKAANGLQSPTAILLSFV